MYRSQIKSSSDTMCLTKLCVGYQDGVQQLESNFQNVYMTVHV